jgi:uncharacterized RDD family membrane protein YckC
MITQETLKKHARCMAEQEEVKHMEEDKCQKCGTPASPGAKYCESCGALLPGAEPSPPLTTPSGPQPEGQREGAPSYAPPPGYQAPPYAAPAVSPYEGVAIRFVAQLIDFVILGVAFWILSFLGAATITIDASTGQTSVDPFFAAIILIDLVIAFFYFTLLEGHFGQTVGKMAVRIKVVKAKGNSSISYGEAAVRTILRIIDLIPFVAPYLLGAVLIWSSDKRQRLGDRGAHTVVVQI